MDSSRFDSLARLIVGAAPRRTIGRALLGAALGAVGLPTWLELGGAAAACVKLDKRCAKGDRCCGGARCKHGTCRCRPGLGNCGGKCVDRQTSTAHCGACDNRCGANEICDDGGCVCQLGTTCGTACVDLETDPDHCGACGIACASGECVHGACTCDPFNNQCPSEVDGQCTCGAIVAEEFQAACVDRNSACDLDKPCDSNDDCPLGSVCLRGCSDPPDPQPNRCSKPCIPV